VLSHSNRQVATDELLLLDRTVSTLVEDCEFYAFHSAAVRVSGGTGDVLRRDYFHGRDWSTTLPPAAIALAPCDSCLLENIVSETNGALVSIPGGTSKASVHNRVLGSISMSGQAGVVASANAGPMNAPDDTFVSDFVAINSQVAAIEALGVGGFRFSQCSAFGGSDGYSNSDFTEADGGLLSTGRPGFTGINSVVSGAMYSGFFISSKTDGGLAFTDAWDNGYDYIPTLGKDAGTLLNVDPGFGDCRVFVPSSSPLKGAGSGGADIGANVLYRTVDSGLTSEPLWAPDTGSFPCGATVAGLNDLAGASCFDLHTRLNIGDGGCPLPGALSAADAGQQTFSAYGLRCSTAPGAAGLWLGALAWLRSRRRRPAIERRP
jgi:hypothetical protein